MKQALKSSGANCTPKHMEDISMCGLFLLDAAKRADQEFQIPYRSSHHTVRSAESDIQKMVSHLLEEKVTCERKDRVDIKFEEPIQLGMQKVVNGWLQNYLTSSGSKSATDDSQCSNQDGELHDGEVDLDYEIHTTTFF